MHRFHVSWHYAANMKNLASPAWIKVKGLLFLFLGLLSATLLFFD